jgi:hypothetical protein
MILSTPNLELANADVMVPDANFTIGYSRASVVNANLPLPWSYFDQLEY